MEVATHKIEAAGPVVSLTENAAATRRLVAVLSGDVVAYARLMATDEEVTVRGIRACRELVTRLVENRRGRLVDFTGDNFLAEFASVVDAAKCAFDIQKELASSNAHLPQHHQMQLRLGLHLGEVRIEDGRLYGSTVNIAARLESLADAGGVCASQAVVREITSRMAVTCEDRGERLVKNIPEAVRIYRLHASDGSPRVTAARSAPFRRRAYRVVLAIMATAFITLGTAGFSATANPPADYAHATLAPGIAVLPFAAIGDGSDERYLADGLVEQMTNALANVRTLRVVARTSAFAVASKGRDIRVIGHLLHAHTVIEGSVQRTGTYVRVTVRAIRVADGYDVWARTYDYAGSDVFAMEDQISRSVVTIVSTELSATHPGA